MDVATLRQRMKPYMVKDDRIAWASVLGTLAVFFAGLALAVRAAATHPALALPWVVVAAFAGVRLYVLQHDLGHFSLFRGRRTNRLVGYAVSPFTLTPYEAMRVNHDTHHAYLGNLDHRETTEIHTMTVREWRDAGRAERLAYRLYRHPAVLLPLGGTWTFLIRYRWPKNAARIGVPGVVAHNLGVLGFFWAMHALGGWTGVAVLLSTAVVSGCIGVFLVYLQHNFEDTYWDRKPDLDFRRATLQGSSALDLGHWWDIGTGNIAYHDIHHFNPQIPSYRLRRCHRALRGELGMPTIEWPEAIRSFRLKLWDEEAGRLVPFPERQAGTMPMPAE